MPDSNTFTTTETKTVSAPEEADAVETEKKDSESQPEKKVIKFSPPPPPLSSEEDGGPRPLLLTNRDPPSFIYYLNYPKYDIGLTVRISTIPIPVSSDGDGDGTTTRSDPGLGLFTTSFIPANSIVCYYRGEIFTTREAMRLKNKDYLMRLGENLYIDGSCEELPYEMEFSHYCNGKPIQKEPKRKLPYPNLGRYINDHKPYNCYFEKKVYA